MEKTSRGGAEARMAQREEEGEFYEEEFHAEEQRRGEHRGRMKGIPTDAASYTGPSKTGIHRSILKLCLLLTEKTCQPPIQPLIISTTLITPSIVIPVAAISKTLVNILVGFDKTVSILIRVSSMCLITSRSSFSISSQYTFNILLYFCLVNT